MQRDRSRTPENKVRHSDVMLKSYEEEKEEPDLDSARYSVQSNAFDQENGDSFEAFGFNQDASCIALGTSNGFQVFMSDPLKCQFEREGMQRIKIAELLFRNQIVALVGKNDPNKVMIWDDYQLRQIHEIKLGQPVLAVKLRKDKIVVVMQRKVHMYNLSDLEFFGDLPTYDNPNGVVALNSTTETFILAVLSENSPNNVYIQLLNNQRESREFRCHSHQIAQLGLNNDGRFLATASVEGTRIKVFSTHTMQELRIFRFSLSTVEITGLQFSKSANYLCATSLQPKLHVWKLGFGEADRNRQNQASSEPDSYDRPQNKIDEESKEQEEQDQYGRQQRLDQGFFRNLVSKVGSAELSHTRWQVGTTNILKKCAFTDDEQSLMLITVFGQYYKLPIEIGEQTITQKPLSLHFTGTKQNLKKSARKPFAAAH